MLHLACRPHLDTYKMIAALWNLNYNINVAINWTVMEWFKFLMISCRTLIKDVSPHPKYVNSETWCSYTEKLTAASLSKRAKSSLSSLTSSWALQDEDSWVKPTMSANKMLQETRTSSLVTWTAFFMHIFSSSRRVILTSSRPVNKPTKSRKFFLNLLHLYLKSQLAPTFSSVPKLSFSCLWMSFNTDRLSEGQSSSLGENKHAFVIQAG